MAFTFSQPRRMTPEESSPFNNLLSNALKSYQQQVHARYAPQQQEAEIFNKRIGPLATLATSPMFLQNPQFQESLGRLLSQNMQGFSGGHEGNGENKFPTYHEQTAKNFEQTKKIADELTKAGKAKGAISGASGWLQTNLGDVGKHISDFFSGGKVTPDLANKEKKFATHLATLKQNAIQTGKLSASDANKEFVQLKNETPEATLERLKETHPSLFDQDAFYQSDASTSDQQMDINVVEQAHKLGVPPVEVQKLAEYFKVSPKLIIGALQSGVESDEDMADYLKGANHG